MTILQVSPRFHPEKGGVETHVWQVSKALLRRKHKVWVLTLNPSSLELRLIKLSLDKSGNLSLATITPDLPKPEQKAHYISTLYKLAVWRQVARLTSTLRRVNIIQVHDVAWWLFPVWPLFAKKIFVTFHGYEGSEPPSWRAVLHRKIVEKLAVGSVCVGEFMKKWYHAKPNLIIYGAGDVRATPRSSRNKAVFLGRFSQDNGVMIYLRALALLKKKIDLDIYGAGNKKGEMQRFIRRKRLSASMHDWTDEVESVLAKARWAFVSRYLAILEAMQAKRLVVAVYDNEIKKDYLLCHPQSKNMVIAGSARELANKLEKLDQSKEQMMIENAYRWAKNQTWDELVKAYLGLWSLKLSTTLSF